MSGALTNRQKCELHPERFCRATVTRGRYTWVCYGQPGHDGPHMAGNSDNDPIYRRWFSVVGGEVAPETRPVRPRQIQRQRTKGWRMPAGAVYVGRPSKWGNPWRIVVDGQWYMVRHINEDRCAGQFVIPEYALQTATRMYYSDLVNDRLPYSVDDVERELGGHDLACWCPPTPLNPNGSLNWLGLQCHAEVLLEIANPVEDGTE